MTIFCTVNMLMGFVILFTFSIPFSSLENHVMHPVLQTLGEHTNQIFVWEEYDLTEAPALSTEGAGVCIFLVTGQARIGLPLILPHQPVLMFFTRENHLLVPNAH